MRTGADDGGTRRCKSLRAGEDLMTDVIDRLVVAMNAHDLDAVPNGVICAQPDA